MLRYYVIFVSLTLISLCSCRYGEQSSQTELDLGIELLGKQKDYNGASMHLLESLARQNEEMPTPMLAKTYYHLSRVYWEQDYTDKAMHYARLGLACSQQLHVDSINARLLTRIASCYYLLHENDSALYYYQQAKEIALSIGNSSMIYNAINNIGAVKISQDDYSQALEYFEMAKPYAPKEKAAESIYHYNRSRCLEQLQKWEECVVEIQASMEYAEATEIEQREQLFHRLYNCYCKLGRYEEACVCADSSFQLSKRLFKLKRREELKNITEHFMEERHNSEMQHQRAYWILTVISVVLFFLVILGVLRYQNHRRVLDMQQRMESLKLQIIREEERTATTPTEEKSDDNTEQPEMLMSLYEKQLLLARDLLKTRPIYNQLRQLQFHTDKGYLDDHQRLPLIDGVTEVFIDSIQNLRNTYPELTPDECLYAVLSFVGCNNAMISILTKTTEPTLRKRRSRFKAKVAAQISDVLLAK